MCFCFIIRAQTQNVSQTKHYDMALLLSSSKFKVKEKDIMEEMTGMIIILVANFTGSEFN